MRLTARTLPVEDFIGVVDQDGRWSPLASVDAFYDDLDAFLDLASRVTGGYAPDSFAAAIPVPRGSRVFCVGLNYLDHITETRNGRPDRPTIFARFRSSLAVDDSEVRVPVGEVGLDYEGELAVVLQCDANGVRPFAYTCFNDVTARAHQHDTTQWTLGKNLDGSGFIGPSLVTSDEFEDGLEERLLRTRLNGAVVQESALGRMLFGPAAVIDRLAEVVDLRSGDVIALGTPSGVGHVRNPPLLGVDGDQFEVEISGIGVLRSRIAGSAQVVHRPPALAHGSNEVRGSQ
jgi:2,4-diketo-3-deoxy-L-fuconate hydrolase